MTEGQRVEQKKRKWVAGKTREEQEDEEAERPLKLARIQGQTKKARGRITRVFYPKTLPDSFPAQACVIIDKIKWKGSFLSLDPDLYTHEVEGHLCTAKESQKFKEPTYIIDNIMTKSVILNTATQSKLFPILIKSCFNADNDCGWTQPDLDMAMQRYREIDWKSVPRFCLHTWLETYAHQQEPWAEMMQQNNAIKTYLLCVNTSKLLQFYKLRHVDKLTVNQRLQLLKLLDEDPYPLCFKNMYSAEFPKLPELKPERLTPAMWIKLGPERLLNVWLYGLLKIEEEDSKNAFTKVEVVRMGHGERTVVRWNAKSKKIQKLNKSFREHYIPYLQLPRGTLPGQKITISLPTPAVGDSGPIVRRLQEQRSIVLTGQRLYLREKWQDMWDIVDCIREFWHRPPPPIDDGVTAMDDDDVPIQPTRYDWDKLIADLQREDADSNLPNDKGETSDGKEEKKDEPKGKNHVVLCDEQKAACELVYNYPICNINGPGGAGKTSILEALKGRCESRWEGEMKVVELQTDEFWTTSKQKTVKVKSQVEKDKKEQKEQAPPVYFLKTHKLVLTPTGAAADEVYSRTGIPAVTIDYFNTVMTVGSGLLRFDQVRILAIDEFGMVGTKKLADLLRNARRLPHLLRIVFLGDWRQLESVDEGNVIMDMIRSWIPSIELKHNHRTKTESKLLFDNAMAIAEHQSKRVKESKGVFELVSGTEVTNSVLYDKYSKRLDEFQIMCFTKKRRDAVNKFWMEKEGFLSKQDLLKESDTNAALRHLYKGEKFVFTKNTGGKQTRVRNKQREIITEIFDTNEPERFVNSHLNECLPGATGPETKEPATKPICYPVKSTREPIKGGEAYKRVIKCQSGFTFICTAELLGITMPAYAITVHSMQGRGIPHAILLQDGNTWDKLIYTAVSRAIESFTFIADPGCNPRYEFLKSCDRPARPRATSLCEMLGKRADKWTKFRCSCVGCSENFTFTLESSSDWPTLCALCLEAAMAD